MKKNGFTFIEILGVITLLALMSVIVLITVDNSLKKSKNTLSDVQISNIRSAASMWRTDNIEMIPDDGYYTLSLGELIDSGYIDNVVNPNDNNNYNRNLLISVGINDISVDDIFVKNGYSKLEYIESTGTQYIDTGVVVTNNTVVMAELFTNYSGNKNWFGGSSNSSDSNFVFNSWSQTQIEYQYGASNEWYKLNVDYDVVGKKFIVEFGNGSLKINNSKKVDLPTDSFTDKNNLYLFLRNGGSANISGRVYTFKIYNGNILIRDFLPAVRNNDNAVGLYDLVNNKFYENKGSGEFIKGEL